MILSCPECETQYFADDSTIGESGRTVKCATCSHMWFVSRSDESASSLRLPGAHETYRAQLLERRRQFSRRAATLAWVGTSAVLIGLIGTSVFFRDEVAGIWPQSASVFRLAGLDVNRFQMEFVSAEPKRFFDGTTPILEVRGAVRNISRKPVEAPHVRVSLIDESGALVAESYSQITPAYIEGRQTGQFTMRIEDPPYEAFELDLSFVPISFRTPANSTGGVDDN